MLNRETLEYDVLSEHPDKYIECSAEIDSDKNIDSQIEYLYCKYLDLHPDYIRFFHLKPYIENQILKLPFYCLIPYNSHEIKNSYKVPCKEYAKFIPDLRQLLNII